MMYFFLFRTHIDCFFTIWSQHNSKKKILMSLFVLLLILTSSSRILAANMPNLYIDEIMYIEDKDKKLDFEKIKNTIEWEIKSSNSFSAGFTKSAYWFKIKIINPESKILNYLFEVEYPMLDSIQLYTANKNEKYTMREAGDTFPFNQREVKDSPSFIFNIDLKPGNNILYARVKTSSSLIFNCNLLSREEYDNRPLSDVKIFVILLSIILFINSYFYFSRKDLLPLLYMLYLLSYIFIVSTNTGLSFQYLWPDSLWLANNGLSIFLASFIVTGSVFYVVNIEEEKHSIPNIIIVILFTTLPAFLMIIGTFFIEYSIVIKLVVVTLVEFILVIFISSIIFSIKGTRAALWIFLGLLSLIPGFGIFILKTFGILPNTLVTQWSLSISLLIMFVLHSPIFKEMMKKEAVSH